MKVKTFGTFHVEVEPDETLKFLFTGFEFDFEGRRPTDMPDDETALAAIQAVCTYMQDHAKLVYLPCGGQA